MDSALSQPGPADGVRIQVTGNIEFPSEAEQCLSRGCDGIGLYRTEFLYLTSPREPTEEDHYAAYAAVVRAMGGATAGFLLGVAITQQDGKMLGMGLMLLGAVLPLWWKAR